MLENDIGNWRNAGTHTENMGGARTFRFALVADIATLPPVVQGVVIGTTTFLVDGREWHTFQPIEDTAQLREPGDRERGGPLFEHEFTCEMAFENAALRMMVDSMVRVPVIAEITDNNGQVRRMGELGDPAWIMARNSTGRGVASRNSWELTITWKHERPCPVVDATFTPALPPEDLTGSDSIGDTSGEFGPG